MSQEKTGIQKAFEMYPSPTQFAKVVGNGCLRQDVSRWLEVGYVTPTYTPRVHYVTGIPCSELCPKVDWSLVGKGTEKTAAAARKAHSLVG